MFVRRILIIASLLLSCAAHADRDVRTFNIESQPLAKALIVFSEQSNVVVMAPASLVEGKQAPAVTGQMSAAEALGKLLQGTGLSSKVDDRGTVLIMAPLKTAQADYAPQSASEQEDSSGWNSSGTEEAAQPSKGAIPEILVSGSRVLNMDIKRGKDDIQPYVVFDRKVIENSGAPNVELFLRAHLTSMIGGGGASAQSSTGSNRSYLDLRGLGSGQTLVLIDGHRAASVSYYGDAQQSDLNGLPVSAIERIEVLPTTASGIYGGGATGGVINIVLRRDYKGVETKLAYEDSFDGGGARRRVDFSGGLDLDGGKTSLMIVGSYTDSNPLLNGDRDYAQRARATIFANNPNAILRNYAPPLAATTNICSATAYSPTFGVCNLSPLVLKGGVSLGSPVTYVPYGYDGPGSDNSAQLIANAGSYNLDLAPTKEYNGGAGEALLNSPTIASLRMTVRREFTSRVQGFLEMAGSKNEGAFTSGYVGPFILPASSPANPFQQAIQITTPGFGVDQVSGETLKSRRVLAGVVVKLPHDWNMGADYTWDRMRFSSTGLSGLTDEAANAVAAGVLNVMRDTNKYPVDFSAYSGAQMLSFPADSTLKDATLRLSGPLGFALPAGKPTVNFALEHRKEDMDAFVLSSPAGADTYVYTYNGRAQSIQSAYVESIVPLVSAHNAKPGIRGLELQVSARHDRYEMIGSNQSVSGPGMTPDPAVQVTDKFSSTDPTVGLKYQPIAGIAFRASYGTGFLPPSLAQLVPAQPQSQTPFGVTDPRRGDEPVGEYTYYQGGNPNLKPEQSVSRSIGVIFTPAVVPDLRMSVDWTQIRKHDNVLSVASYLDTQSLIDNEALYPGVITRGPASGGYPVGPITAIDGSLINISRQNVSAYDIALDYRWDTAAWGSFSFTGAATRNLYNTTQLLPVLPQIEAVGMVGNRKWLANGTLNWRYRNWTARWASRFLDAYWLRTDHTVVANAARAGNPSRIYHDASVNYVFDASARTVLSGLDAQVGIRNVFNTRSPLLLTTGWAPFYDPSADPRGSTYFLSLKKTF